MEKSIVSLPPEGLVPFSWMFSEPPRSADPERGIRERSGRLGFWGLSKSKAYDLIKQGHLPSPIRVGKKALIDVEVARAVKDRLAAQGVSA